MPYKTTGAKTTRQRGRRLRARNLADAAEAKREGIALVARFAYANEKDGTRHESLVEPVRVDASGEVWVRDEDHGWFQAEAYATAFAGLTPDTFPKAQLRAMSPAERVAADRPTPQKRAIRKNCRDLYYALFQWEHAEALRGALASFFEGHGMTEGEVGYFLYSFDD